MDTESLWGDLPPVAANVACALCAMGAGYRPWDGTALYSLGPVFDYGWTVAHRQCAERLLECRRREDIFAIARRAREE